MVERTIVAHRGRYRSGERSIPSSFNRRPGSVLHRRQHSFLLRDRDASYGSASSKRVAPMGVPEVVTAPRSPWQNGYVERVIGSIRRECLDQVVIFNERHLRHLLSSYVDYYHRARTHLSLDKDCPRSRPIQPPRSGRVIAILQV